MQMQTLLITSPPKIKRTNTTKRVVIDVISVRLSVLLTAALITDLNSEVL